VLAVRRGGDARSLDCARCAQAAFTAAMHAQGWAFAGKTAAAFRAATTFGIPTAVFRPINSNPGASASLGPPDELWCLAQHASRVKALVFLAGVCRQGAGDLSAALAKGLAVRAVALRDTPFTDDVFDECADAAHILSARVRVGALLYDRGHSISVTVSDLGLFDVLLDDETAANIDTHLRLGGNASPEVRWALFDRVARGQRAQLLKTR